MFFFFFFFNIHVHLIETCIDHNMFYWNLCSLVRALSYIRGETYPALALVVCIFRYFTSVYNLKAIEPLLMEILHFEDVGYKCRQRMQFGC